MDVVGYLNLDHLFIYIAPGAKRSAIIHDVNSKYRRRIGDDGAISYFWLTATCFGAEILFYAVEYWIHRNLCLSDSILAVVLWLIAARPHTSRPICEFNAYLW